MATVVLAGGGTAGHVEPALAVAREWRDTFPKDRIIFLGTVGGLENRLVPAAGFELVHIPKVRITRKPSLSWLRIPLDFFAAISRLGSILKDVDLLIGFGGYVSGPAYVSARISGIPTVIHEANAKPGWANRLGALMTSYLAVASEVDSREFTDALITGLPLRADVAKAYESSFTDFARARSAAKERLGFNSDSPLIFIMGGSQGSQAINAAVEKAIPVLVEKGFSILHSVGMGNVLPSAQSGYKPVGYVDAMADAYLASDLVIARSGAVTCSEFRTLGRYALFIPLPIGNGEQRHNARALVENLRAEIVEQSDFNAEYLITHIDGLLSHAAAAPNGGSDSDMQAAQKIVALGEFAMSKR